MESQHLRHIIFAIAALIVTAMAAIAQDKDETYPVPSRIPHMLFYLQRSLDQNSVIYEANLSDEMQGGKRLDGEKPVNIYWLLDDEKHSTKELSGMQRLGYGIKTEEADDNLVQLHLVAYKKMPIKVRYSPKQNRYLAYVSVDGKEVILKKVFINIDGGSRLKPNVTFIELSGTTAQTGHQIVHRFRP